jgi:hypothetical protein
MPILTLPVTCPGVSSEIRVTKGTAKSFEFGVGTDLTAATVRIDVRRRITAPDILITKGITILAPATDGNVRLDFVPADYAAVASGTYVFDIIKTVSAVDTVLFSGRFFLEPFDQAFIGLIEPILKLAIVGTSERFSLEVRDELGVLGNPVELQVVVLDPADQRVLFLQKDVDVSLINPEGGIFYFDFQSNRDGDFLAIWTYRFEGEEPQTVVKNVRWVNPAMFRMIPEVRLYIDKSRKASNRTIAFNAPDVCEYIANSVREFNAQSPTTDIKLESFDGVFNIYKSVIIEGAIIQALVAQGLLAVDQDFQYNDNGISLAIDHSAKLQSWYTTILNQYIAKKSLYKKNFFVPTVYARTIVGQAFSLGLAKVPASTLSRFRGWI